MVSFEKTYCEVLKGNYSANSDMIKISLNYVVNEITKIELSLKECSALIEEPLLMKDYLEYKKSLKKYERRKHI